ncbi:phosphotransferase family protein [Streptomyces sp. NPDC050400]|uniref:phosphotransferase family protein n=1 Tax=Streptomyces sp. NPDC050400 TaxID=3365610 RepID=UPI0037AB7799
MGAVIAPSAQRSDEVAEEETGDLWDAVAVRARHHGEVRSGHHNTNLVVRLTDEEAAVLGRPPGSRVVVRSRKAGTPRVVIRSWADERAVLDAIDGTLGPVPQCLARRGELAFHSYMEGGPLSDTCPNGKPVDPPLVDAFAGLLADMARVPEGKLPPRPPYWPREGDSRGFLRTLLIQADEQIRKPNWTDFGGLFVALGVPEDALTSRCLWVPDLSSRPFSLLHGDLHRDNAIVTDKGDSPLFCVDWELATYGDPLYDLAVHLVRMAYPQSQWVEVIERWRIRMGGLRPEAVVGLDDDLRHYVDFEHAQSVYPDVIRAVSGLGTSFGRAELAVAAQEIHRALKLAQSPLGLRDVLDPEAIAWLVHRWKVARGVRLRGEASGAAAGWLCDSKVPLRDGFPGPAVEAALRAEGAAAARQVFKGTAHLATVVRVAGREPVMVRRKFGTATPLEPRFLKEHKVLRAIEESPAMVCAPRVLALGTSDFEDEFTIHSYEGPPDDRRRPRHPVHGLLPCEVNSLVDQLAELARVDVLSLAQPMDGLGFYEWLCGRLVGMVEKFSPASKALAARLGLPDEVELARRLAKHEVADRRAVLLHGDLNPWNMVRQERGFGLTLIDWEMAMVGDPLHDLVRHIHLTPTTREVRERMTVRWARTMPDDCTPDWERDVPVYQGLELVRSAYVDLDRMVTGCGLDAPNVRRAVGSYSTTLRKALDWLDLSPGSSTAANPYLVLALAPPVAVG